MRKLALPGSCSCPRPPGSGPEAMPQAMEQTTSSSQEAESWQQGLYWLPTPKSPWKRKRIAPHRSTLVRVKAHPLGIHTKTESMTVTDTRGARKIASKERARIAHLLDALCTPCTKPHTGPHPSRWNTASIGPCIDAHTQGKRRAWKERPHARPTFLMPPNSSSRTLSVSVYSPAGAM
jgi:hypothetical protein